MPRFCTIQVWTTDPTVDEDVAYIGTAFVISWLGRTFEFQFARREA